MMDVTTVLLLEIPDMQLHYDPMFDSLYIVGSCHFRLYLFSRRDFVIPLFHPTFDPSIPYFAIPLHVAHAAPPPPPAALATTPPASPPRWSRTSRSALRATHPRLLIHPPPPLDLTQTTLMLGLVWPTATWQSRLRPADYIVQHGPLLIAYDIGPRE